MKNTCGHMPSRMRNRLTICTAFFSAASLLLLSGCGGGSSSGGSSAPTTTLFSGSVTNTASSIVASGFTVRFDTSGPTTVTNSVGGFTLNVPNGDVTGHDTIYVLDSNGFVVANTTLSNDSNGDTSIQVNVGPPPTPPLVIHA